MLKRQKIILALLNRSSGSLSSTNLVKFMFLLRKESLLKEERTFYDFVPYKFGPFSFALYRELSALERDGYISHKKNEVSLESRTHHYVMERVNELPGNFLKAIAEIVQQYGRLHQRDLLRSVYERYPWYASKSERKDLVSENLPESSRLPSAVYTIGYEGSSVDGFFDGLLRNGIQAVLDVRYNPVSRKYGFARKSMSEIAHNLGIEYHHFPELGIPGSQRVNLNDFTSYQRLLNRYQDEMLPDREREINFLVERLRKKPSALLCMEKDPECCHRSRLASAASRMSGLPVVHL